MHAATKMIIFHGQALLEGSHALLEVFQLLVAHADLVVRVGFWWSLVWVIGLHFVRILKCLDSVLPLSKLVVDLTLQEKCLGIIRFFLEYLEKQRFCLVSVLLRAVVLEQDTCQFDHDLNVRWQELVSLPQVLNTLFYIFFAAYNAPAKTKLYLADDLIRHVVTLGHLQSLLVLVYSREILANLIIALAFEQV